MPNDPVNATTMSTSVVNTPRPNTIANDPPFPVIERFVSINGEGAHAGKLAAFIRFSGCNLRCSYCDTVWAQDSEATVELLSTDELVSWVASQPCACVTITGGEPTLQARLLELATALSALDAVEVVEIETNGSTDLATFAHERPQNVSLTMDYKLPSSGMERQMCLTNLGVIDARDVVKFVIGTREDLETMLRVVRDNDLDQRCQVYLSPVFGQIEPASIVDFMREQRLTGATLQLQLHKFIWPDQERGV